MRRGFTLIEMTIVIAIVGILAGMALSVYATAASQAKEMRTRAIIGKIDDVVSGKWDSYSTSPLPIKIQPKTSPVDAALLRTLALAEFQRLELPETIGEVTTNPGVVTAGMASAVIVRPSISRNFLRRAKPGWTAANESAECLYLILAGTRTQDASHLDYFSPSEIGDIDNDGMNEILDSFGRPIQMSRRIDGMLVFSSGVDANDAADDLTNHN